MIRIAAIRSLVLAALAAGCAASAPSDIALNPIERTRPADPQAMAHFVEAKMLALRGQHHAAVAALRAAVAFDSTSATLHSELARTLHALGRLDEVAEPAKRALQLEPDDQATRWIYYESLIGARRDTGEALEQLQILARGEAEPLRAYDYTLRIYVARQDREGVLTTLDRISTLPNLDTRGKLIAAGNYQRYGRSARAAALLEEVVQENPGEIDAWSRLASLQLASGDTSATIRSLRTAVPFAERTSSRAIEQIYRQVVILHASGSVLDSLLAEEPLDSVFSEKLSEAFVTFAKGESDPGKRKILLGKALRLISTLVGNSPSRPDLRAKQGELLLNLGHPIEARGAFEKADALVSDPRHRLGIAHTYLAQDLQEAAIRILEPLYGKVDGDFPLYDQVVFGLGGAYVSTDQLPKAREIYRTAYSVRPQHDAFQFELGRTHVWDQNWERAIEIFEELVPGSADNAVTLGSSLWELARAYERNGQFDDAVRAFERLIALHPRHDGAMNYLGYMLAERGLRLAEAEAYVRRALEEDKENGAYLDSMGWVLYQRGDYGNARTYLMKALQLEIARGQQIPDRSERAIAAHRENIAVIYEHVGDVEAALKNPEQARIHWQKALENDPGNDRIREKLQALDNPNPDGSIGASGPPSNTSGR